MTNEERVQAYAMRLEGCSLQECAERFGVTREYIRQITPPIGNYARTRSKYDKCLYPRIADWLYENRFSYTRFCKMINVSAVSGRAYLTGETRPTKDFIDAVLLATGMKYEEAFATKED